MTCQVLHLYTNKNEFRKKTGRILTVLKCRGVQLGHPDNQRHEKTWADRGNTRLAGIRSIWGDETTAMTIREGTSPTHLAAYQKLANTAMRSSLRESGD